MKATRASARRSARAGFTLIEILAVVLIVGILATILVTQLGGAQEAAKVESTRRWLAEVSGVIDHYSNEYGDYPRSTFAAADGEAANETNAGVEALVVALFSRGWEAGGLLPSVEDRLGNTDHDQSSSTLTDFGNRNLLELLDEWENPVAYLHRQDYEITNRPYVTYSPETGEELVSFPRARRNETTGRFYRSQSYQLISAGPDGEFGTDDDITLEG